MRLREPRGVALQGTTLPERDRCDQKSGKAAHGASLATAPRATTEAGMAHGATGTGSERAIDQTAMPCRPSDAASCSRSAMERASAHQNT